MLCERLLDVGHSVTVLDNFMFGQTSLLHLGVNPLFEIVRGDVRDEANVARLVKSADVVIPLAALVGAPLCDRDPHATTAINHGVISTLVRLRSPSQLIVYPTTNSGYGTKSGAQFCTKETLLEPISPYGRTKVGAEQEVLSSPNTVTLRLATVFGLSPRMVVDLLVNHFVFAAVTDGYIVIFEKDLKRNYIHIRDVADCFVHCIDNHEAMRGRPYNKGLDRANLSKNELALKVKQHVPGFYIHFAEVGSAPTNGTILSRTSGFGRLGSRLGAASTTGSPSSSRGIGWSARRPTATYDPGRG